MRPRVARFLKCLAFGNFGRNRDKRPKILVLVDWENLQWQIGFSPGRPSLKDRLDSRIKEVAAEVGGVLDVFVFMPPHISYTWGESLHEKGFFIVACPKIRNKAGEETDTTDETIIKFGEMMMDNVRGLTHLCLASGDKDFSPLLNRAQRKGLENIIIAGDIKSLAGDVISLASQRKDGSRRVYILYES